MQQITRQTIVECPQCGSGLSHYSRNGGPEKYGCRACYVTLPANDLSLAVEGVLRTALLAIPLLLVIWVLGLTPNEAQAKSSNVVQKYNPPVQFDSLHTGIKNCNWSPGC
jgi:hypothetical protein